MHLDAGVIALVAVPTFTMLGGLAHVVYRLGRLTEKVDGLGEDMDRVFVRVWPITQASSLGDPASRRKAAGR